MASPGYPGGEVSLGVEWNWRIEDQTAIRCGSWSEENRWESAIDVLRLARITQALKGIVGKRLTYQTAGRAV